MAEYLRRNYSALSRMTCCRWIIHANREGISEGDVLQLMAFLGEVDRALTTQKSVVSLPVHPVTLPQRRFCTYTRSL